MASAMKWRLPFTLCVVVVGLVLTEATIRPARSASGKKSRKGGSPGCKYFRKISEISECDQTTGLITVTVPLKKGVNCPPERQYTRPCSQADEASADTANSVRGCKYDRKAPWTDCGNGAMSKKKVMLLKPGQPSSCPPSLTKTVPCKKRKNKAGKPGCKYDRKAPWTDCGNGAMSKMKVMSLKPGQPSSCPATRTKTVPCKKRKNKGGKSGKANKPGKGKKKKGCKYQKSAWSDCDPTSNTRTRQLTLKKGDPALCQPKNTIIKKCRKPCKYSKGDWLPCNEATNEKTRVLILKKGDPNFCNATRTITKPCHRRDAFTAAKTSQCKYKPQGWSECDSHTNTMTRVLQLKSGDPELCQPSKQVTRKCRRRQNQHPCKYSKGEWSECDRSKGIRKRTDRLVKGDPSKCDATREITRKCEKGADCKYETGDWGECDPVTKERSRTKTLVSGDPAICRPMIQVSRPCFKPNGEESCFLGSWGEYGACQNGVMMKHRPVIAGGVQCERKAVKTKSCS